MSSILHLPVIYRPEGESRHTIPAEVCNACSNFETGLLVPASFCDEANRHLGTAPWEPPRPPCTACGSTDRIPYAIKPPSGHSGLCTPSCTVETLLCRDCHMVA